MKYIPHSGEEVKKMMESIGVSSPDSLFSLIPPEKRLMELNIPGPFSEVELSQVMTRLSRKNRAFYDRPNFLGAGVYNHYSPAVVDTVLSRPEFYTAYTPYQAEASQGILQTIFEFQTLICMLTGMDVANASHYDGATACAEGITMAIAQSGKKKIFYSAGVHPQYIEVMKTYHRWNSKVHFVELPLNKGVTCLTTLRDKMDADTAGILIQNPNCLGFIEPVEKIAQLKTEMKSKGLLVVAVNEPLSLGLLKNPGDCGADIAVGEGLSLGLPPSYGGPGVGFMAIKDKYLRRLPGRIVGQTLDTEGKTAYCLTLQTREQHIRREKASSNICSNQALCALAVTVYLSHVGKRGFSDLARLNFQKAFYLKEKICQIPGYSLYAEAPFFNEFTVRCPADPVKLSLYLKDMDIIGGFRTGIWGDQYRDCMTFAVTEMNTRQQIDDLTGYLANFCRQEVSVACTTD